MRHAAGHGVDLGVDIDHVSSPSVVRVGHRAGMPGVRRSRRPRRRRARRPRASSVPSASRCGCQNRRNGSNQASAASSGGGIDGVQPPRAVGAHGRETRLAQHAQVLRHRRLRDAELALDDLAELAGAALSVGEELEHAPAHRISEDVECVHGLNYCATDLYKSRRDVQRAAVRRMVAMPTACHALPPVPSRSSEPGRWAARSCTASSARVWPHGGVTATNRTRGEGRRARRRSTASRASRSKTRPTGNAEAAASAGIVLVGVKPAMVPDLLREIAPHLRPGTIVVSLAAGVTIATFESILGADVAVLRSMPNTPAVVGKARDRARGRDARATADDVARRPRAVRDRRRGRSRCPSRRSTRCRRSRAPGPPTSSCSSRSSRRRPIGKGFAEAEARLMAEQTFIGAAALLEASGEDPAELRRRVTSPKGTTERAVAVLQDARTSTACSPRRRMPRLARAGSSPPARAPAGRSRVGGVPRQVDRQAREAPEPSTPLRR